MTQQQWTSKTLAFIRVKTEGTDSGDDHSFVAFHHIEEMYQTAAGKTHLLLNSGRLVICEETLQTIIDRMNSMNR